MCVSHMLSTIAPGFRRAAESILRASAAQKPARSIGKFLWPGSDRSFAAALRDMVECMLFSHLIGQRFARNLVGAPNAIFANALASVPITAAVSLREIGKKSAKPLPFSGPEANSPVA